MVCPRCHAENREGRRFCGECGLSFASTCPSCGFLNEGGEKFCGGCGRSLTATASPVEPRTSPQTYTPKHLAEKILTSKSALEGERKQVTVLFADLKGSMELLADRDPEEARKILDPVLERMMEAVHRYEGTVNQVMGDGIMSLFGAPLAHEDHAVRACYAALRMQESVRHYAESVFRRFGAPIQIRVGLNSGDVVVRAIGSDLHMDYTAVGQCTHLAARMEQMAQPGTILLTPATLALAEGFVQVASRGRVPVKGLAEPIEIFELAGASLVRSRLVDQNRFVVDTASVLRDVHVDGGDSVSGAEELHARNSIPNAIDFKTVTVSITCPQQASNARDRTKGTGHGIRPPMPRRDCYADSGRPRRTTSRVRRRSSRHSDLAS